ncbi:MAG: D-alanyl-D-alanine carboxypeptidase family protein [Campylobacterota bacterium]|nr:D-alanyl-D-alanine carboxypeptidase family protein [Campylobacterota bacterium]
MNRRDFLLLTAFSPVFAKDFIKKDTDIYLTKDDLETLPILYQRLKNIKRYVGFGNFNTISLDSSFYYARNYSSIGSFSNKEKKLIEKLFYTDPKEFGFYGDSTVEKISNKISKKDITKIPYSGHYVFKGKPYEDYKRVLKDVNSDLILTSGVRNVVKQLSLYINKLMIYKGNLTKASSIIAPPAFTYHACSDFDIGKKGWGYKNFTSAFARTDEFKEIRKLNYIGIRYTINNKDGVRFEPWHVKVI